MTASVYIVLLLAGSAAALVNLDCSDNATCIETLTKDLVRNLRENRAVKLFDAVTIEPVSTRQARASEGIWKFIEGHAVSFDWDDFTFRLSVPKDGRDDALELEMFQGKSAKDGSDPNPKKSSSKVEEEQEEDKTPKGAIRRRRRHKKKVLQALVPLLFGMKSAGVVIFAFALVSALTIKAFVASKLALLVTIGMAVKKLYESYSTGLPETSNVLWSITRFFKILFGFPAIPPLSHQQTMTIPMYVMPQMYGPPMTMPPNPMTMT